MLFQRGLERFWQHGNAILGAFSVADQNLVLEREGRKIYLVPDVVRERGADYELISCRASARKPG